MYGLLLGCHRQTADYYFGDCACLVLVKLGLLKIIIPEFHHIIRLSKQGQSEPEADGCRLLGVRTAVVPFRRQFMWLYGGITHGFLHE